MRSAAVKVSAARVAPALALVLNAFVWGVSWWPFRQLQGHGLHPLWATALVYLLAITVITLWRPRSWRELCRTPALWGLVLAAGTTNAAFNWGVTIGDVVRVVLLFYLMPLWSVVLARLLLGEHFSGLAGVRVLLALAGAAIVLWPPAGVSAWSPSLADGLGVLGGFTFALNNVLLRREAHQPEGARALAMFVGGSAVSALLATVMASRGAVPWPPTVAPAWLGVAAVLALMFLLGNLALQYGAARLRAGVTAVLLVTEVLFASTSALLLGAGEASWPLAIGGSLIVAAALLASLSAAPDAAARRALAS